jgi:hypothetical protein
MESNMSDTDTTTATTPVSELLNGTDPGKAPEFTGTEHLEPAPPAKASGPSDEERGWQRRHNKLEDQVRPLKAYLDNSELGGAKGVAQILANTSRLWADPKLAPILKTFFETGQVKFPNAQRSADDYGTDFDAPESKPWESDTEALRQEISALKQGLTGIQKSTGLRSISEHRAKFDRLYPMNAEEKAKFEDAMDARIDRLVSTPQGVAIANQMSWDDFESMGLPAINAFRGAIEERRRQIQLAENAQRATDAPGIGTGGDESAPTKLPRSRAELAQQAKRALRAVSG